MMDPKRLWAKSKRDDETEHRSMLLPGHLQDVYHAAERVLDATADDQLRALGLDVAAYGNRLRRIVLLAAAVHDLGKANDHFQGMILGTRNVRTNPQGLRHEWVTVLMLRNLRDWLLPAVAGNETDFAIVEWAVAGHHPAADHPSPPPQTPDGSGVEIQFLAGHKDFADALEWLETGFTLPPHPRHPTATLTLGDSGDVVTALTDWKKKAWRMWDKLKRLPDARLVPAVKSCLIAADVAGSALPKARPGDSDPWNWIGESLKDRPRPGDLQTVVDHRLGGKKPRAFQIVVAASPARVSFVKAGCGSGKTLAAYMWAARNHPTRRLYFCYPTTGTSTEGFRDYLFDEAEKTPRVGADLFHGRADVDFDLILGTDRDADPFDEARRLDSLRAWKTPVVACTVDTVLGLVQNNRRGLFGWPALAQSAFVFDEIHAFDDRLFGALLRFLRDLPGLPVLLMTASLPKAREDALREILGELTPIPGPAELEERPRYRKAIAAGGDPVPLVNATLDAGGKVLWVCNTVGRVMDAVGRVTGRRPLIYHSRFKYEDRVRRHADVIGGFKGDGPAVAICSQVAEMSLDLSADLLVTDLAPVPALIQRLGRLNRRAEAGSPTRPFVLVEPDGPLPYKQADLDAARAWLGRLPDDTISQLHLADAWEQEGDHPPELIGSVWRDGGPETAVKELRDGSPGVTVLMHQDVARVKIRPADLQRLILPMPPRKGWELWPRGGGLPVAPPDAITYAPMRGAEWLK
jgi:CRISPR-associated endonuclease/helicase Cas3